MRKEYDLKKLRVKRRGPLPDLEESRATLPKIRITISLDQDVVDHFKAEAAKPGALPYQTQINQTLRRCLEDEQGAGEEVVETIKIRLLEDPGFVAALSRKLAHSKGK